MIFFAKVIHNIFKIKNMNVSAKSWSLTVQIKEYEMLNNKNAN